MKETFLSKSSSDSINLLKCLLCIGVVFIHTSFRPGESTLLFGTNWEEGVDYLRIKLFLQIFVHLFLMQICVPLFFMVSGFLFFLKAPEDLFCLKWFLNKWKSRIKSLLIPYLIANSIFIVFIEGFNFFIGGGTFDLLKIFSGFWEYDNGLPADPPLWFVRDLIMAVLLSPLFFIIIKKSSWLLPVLIGVLWMVDFSEDSFVLWKPKAYFFFSLGAWLAIKQIDWVALFRKGPWLILYFILYISILSLYLLYENKVFLTISVPLGFSLFISLSKTITVSMTKVVEQKYVVITFFIFLYHYYIAPFMWRPYCVFFGTSEVALLFAYLFGALTTIVLFYYFYILINKFLPKFTSLIIGGRA